jgi:hypothetical protein
MQKNRNGDFPIVHSHEPQDDGECNLVYWDGNFPHHFFEKGVCQPQYQYYGYKQRKYRTRPAMHREFAKFDRAGITNTMRSSLAKAKYLSREDIEDYDPPAVKEITDLWWHLL